MNTDLIIDKTNGEFENLLRFAWNHKDQASLKNCIDHLELMCKNRNEHTVAEICTDNCPMSVSFILFDKITSNVSLCGRIVFRGSIKGVSIEDIDIDLKPIKGWQLHIL